MYADKMKQYTEALSSYKSAVSTFESSFEENQKQIEMKYDNIVLSSRNLENAEVADARTLNVYQILNANCLVISESALNRLTDMLS